MAEIPVEVVRVFTDPAGQYGNPLGIVAGALVPPGRRQELAAVLGYSETAFVTDLEAGEVSIFSPAGEMPFAGHPTVGIAWWLRSRGYAAETLRVPAGEILVSREGELTFVRARTEWGPDFTWVQLAAPDEVVAADPGSYPAGLTFLWAWTDEAAGRIRARMFAPAVGAPEDEATGSAATQLTGRLERDLRIVQGAGSQLHTAWLPGGYATVGGRVVADEPRIVSF